MKKKIIFLIFCLFLPILCFCETKTLNIYLFKGEGCPHCKELREFLVDYIDDKDYISLNEYEVWNNEENAKILEGVKDITGVKTSGVPYLIIGDKTLVGYSKSNDEEIINYINYYSNNYFDDKVGYYISNYSNEDVDVKEENIDDDSFYIDGIVTNKDIINNSTLPYNIKNIISMNSSSISSIILGLISSFNISFIVVLIIFMCIFFLYKEIKYKYIIGSLFLLSSFIVNFIFINDGFDISILLGKTTYIRLALCFLLMIYGVYKIVFYIGKMNKKTNILIESIFLFIIFILVNTLFVYSNLAIPSIFRQIIFEKRVFNSILYCLFSIILITLFFIFFIELSRLKCVKKWYKIYYLILCFIILVISCVIVSKSWIF